MMSRTTIVGFVLGVGSCVFFLLGLAGRGQATTQAVVSVRGWEGKLAGVKSWQLPDTPGGLRPIQSWFSVGSSPNGDIYVAGSDHRTNSALYRLDVKTDILRYVGDAKSASRKANNWLDGETAEKFHTRPTWYNGRMYVASTDYSRLDDNYVAKRGFHWYAYDIPDSTFLDLSISEPKGVGAEHAQVMAIAVDSQRGYLYGIGTPRSHIYQHEIATGRTKDLGRHPALQRKYYEPGRYIWVDSKGRVYFTVESVPHVLYYDSETEWGAHRDWRLKAGEIKVGQWSLDGKRCYVSDYEAHFYRFDDDQRTWTYLGQGDFDRKYGPSRRNDNTFITRSLNLSADEKKIYFPNDRAVETFALFEWDVSTPASTPLCELSSLDERIAGTQYQYHSGHNSWDNEGRFYFVSFGSRSAMHDAILTRVDPVRLKVALGLLSSLTEVTIRFTAEKDVVVTRTGETSELLEVILAVEASQVNGLLPNNRYAHVVIPAGSSTVTVSRSEIIPEQVGRTGEVSWTVIPNGNTYIAYDAEIRD